LHLRSIAFQLRLFFCHYFTFVLGLSEDLSHVFRLQIGQIFGRCSLRGNQLWPQWTQINFGSFIARKLLRPEVYT
jgi:hypothetical protein